MLIQHAFELFKFMRHHPRGLSYFEGFGDNLFYVMPIPLSDDFLRIMFAAHAVAVVGYWVILRMFRDP